MKQSTLLYKIVIACLVITRFLRNYEMAKPAYVIVDVDIHDHDAYEDYKAQVTPLVSQFGGEYLARGGTLDIVLDQLWKPTRMVLLKFPSREAAKTFMDSEEYAPIRKKREDNSTGTVILLEGIE